MKSYIADTLIGIFAFDEIGNILNFIDFGNDTQKIIEFYSDITNSILQPIYKEFLVDMKNSGFDEYIFDNNELKALTSQIEGCKTIFERISPELKNFRLNLEIQLKKIGMSKTKDEILTIYKKISQELTKKKLAR